MKNNIFENAQFGDKFQTREGKMAVYIEYNKYRNCHILLFEHIGEELYDENGKLCYIKNDELCYMEVPNFDIVSKWDEKVINVKNIANEEFQEKLKGENTLSLWKKIKEEPKEKGLYLTYSESNGINIAFWNNSWCSYGETIDTNSITHWMPLPNKPID